jgi:hypothetical protein
MERGHTAPITAIRGTEEEVLQDDGHEVPKDDFPSEQRLVERRHLARALPIVVGKTENQEETNGPEEHGDGITNGAVRS